MLPLRLQTQRKHACSLPKLDDLWEVSILTMMCIRLDPHPVSVVILSTHLWFTKMGFKDFVSLAMDFGSGIPPSLPLPFFTYVYLDFRCLFCLSLTTTSMLRDNLYFFGTKQVILNDIRIPLPYWLGEIPTFSTLSVATDVSSRYQLLSLN